MKTVTVLGKEVKIRYNLATQIAYEDITGEPFEMSEISTTRKKQAALYMAAIIANNPEIEIKMDDLMREASRDEIKALDEALAEEIAAWYKIPEKVLDDLVGKGTNQKHSERP